MTCQPDRVRKSIGGKIPMKITRSLQRMTSLLGCAGLLLLPCPQAHAVEPSSPQIGYEVVGQVLNVSPQQSLQYGYLNYVRGLARVARQPGAISEATALLTFYNDTATERVINNGPIRLIDRTGTSTVYFDESGLASFVNPDTFRDGKAVQVCSLRHQVLDRKSTRLNSSHMSISYAVFCLKKK